MRLERYEPWATPNVIEDLTFDMYLCWITSPSTLVHTDSSTNVDTSGTATTLTVSINPFTINDSAQCGGLVYTVVSSHADSNIADIFTSGDASFDSVDTFTFNNIKNYPTGDMTITIKVWQAISD